MEKNVIITGAAAGIGLELVKYFAANNYNLFLIDKNEIPKISDAKAEYFIQDTTNFAATEKCIQDILRKTDTVDVLVNNAGISIPGLFNLSMDEMLAMLQTNVLSHFNITKLVGAVMKKRKSGYIFNIASRHGLDTNPGLGGYGTSKFGLMGFNEALFEEYLKDNVKVTAIAPSAVNTHMADYSSKVEPKDRIPTSDIAATIDYLLKLNPNTYVREIALDCHASLLNRS